MCIIVYSSPVFSQNIEDLLGKWDSYKFIGSGGYEGEVDLSALTVHYDIQNVINETTVSVIETVSVDENYDSSIIPESMVSILTSMEFSFELTLIGENENELIFQYGSDSDKEVKLVTDIYGNSTLEIVEDLDCPIIVCFPSFTSFNYELSKRASELEDVVIRKDEKNQHYIDNQQLNTINAVEDLENESQAINYSSLLGKWKAFYNVNDDVPLESNIDFDLVEVISEDKIYGQSYLSSSFVLDFELINVGTNVFEINFFEHEIFGDLDQFFNSNQMEFIINESNDLIMRNTRDVNTAIICAEGEAITDYRKVTEQTGEEKYQKDDVIPEKSNETSSSDDNESALTEFLDKHISVYPNPTKDFFFLENIDLQQHTLTIYDMNGKLVMIPEPNTNSISLEHLPNGLYKLVIQNLQNDVQHFNILKTE